MPKRLAVGTSLGLFSSSAARKAAARRLATQRKTTKSACIESLENRCLLSTSYVVAPWGNDGSAGTVNAPFRTIQRAANVANWGDTVLIRGGTYHEQVHPAHGGVTFQNYNGESVTVSGADQVTNWSWSSGNIYSAWTGIDRGVGNNQVFVNGQLVNEARWPNSTNVSYPSLAYAQGVSGGWGNATIYDSHLSGGWAGASIHIMPGEGWYAQTGTVTGSGNGWLSFTWQSDNSYTQPRAGNGYYLYGKFQALDSPGEFYRDSSGRLYLWAPNSGNPNGADVEMKNRQFAFDLSGDSNITIRGINIFAATIKTDGGSSNFLMDGVNASYISQFTWAPIGYSVPWDSGIELNGNNSTVQNSTIAFSAGDGVYVNSSGDRVANNTIHDVDTNGGDSAAVRDFGNYATISNNTIYNAGRCGVIDRAYGTQVIGNTIHDVMLQTSDGGAIYTIHGNGGGGSQFAWNTIYNVHDNISSPHPDWYTANGIFLDDYSGGFSIHDNKIWNTDAAVKLNYTSNNNQIYNNYLAGNRGSIIGNGQGNWNGTQIWNNTLTNGINQQGWGAAVWSNSYSSASPVPPPVATPTSASGGGGGGGSSSGPAYSAKDTWKAAQYYNASGVNVTGGTVGSADNGDWIHYHNVDFGGGVSTFTANIAVTSQYAGQKIVLRLDGPNGQIIGTLVPQSTGSWYWYNAQSTSISNLTGVHDLYITFVGWSGVANIDWWKFS